MLCEVLIYKRGHSGDGCLSSSILFKYECSKGTFVCSELGQGMTCCSGVLFWNDIL